MADEIMHEIPTVKNKKNSSVNNTKFKNMRKQSNLDNKTNEHIKSKIVKSKSDTETNWTIKPILKNKIVTVPNKKTKKKKKLPNEGKNISFIDTKDCDKSETEATKQPAECQKEFHEMGIDERILEGVAQLRWKKPTLVQEKAIPFMLAGRNVVAQARTGSGKTGAFLIPCLHRALIAKAAAEEQAVRVLVLAPSKELCRQIGAMAEKLAVGCCREIRVLDLSAQVPLEYQRPLLAELPDVVVGPPGRVLSHVLAGHLSLTEVQSVVVDEADLMMAYQHSASIEELWKHMPDYHQCFVTSATLSKDLKRINQLLLKDDPEKLLNTVVLKLKDPPLPTQSQLAQFVIKIQEFEKTVLLYALYHLRMIAGKTIIFVNSVNKGYKLRMFLGQFGISICLLNSELPATSRLHIIEQFNAGRYDTIIATDETTVHTKPDQDKEGDHDIESGTSRGLDFQFVSNIINFDFPPTVNAYIHRVGRTARGNNQGTALSMISTAENESFTAISKKLNKMMLGGYKRKGKTDLDGIFKNYAFDLNQLDGFSYRAQDVWRMCTKKAIANTRKKEVKQQLLKCKKLEAYFKDNPSDRDLLRHDKSNHGIITQKHLRNLPDYNIPAKLRASAGVVGGGILNENVTMRPTAAEAEKMRKYEKGRRAVAKSSKNKRHSSKNKQFGKLNPLKKMSFAGFKK